MTQQSGPGRDQWADSRFSRRQLLAATSGVGLTAVAGCSGIGDGSDPDTTESNAGDEQEEENGDETNGDDTEPATPLKIGADVQMGQLNLNPKLSLNPAARPGDITKPLYNEYFHTPGDERKGVLLEDWNIDSTNSARPTITFKFREDFEWKRNADSTTHPVTAEDYHRSKMLDILADEPGRRPEDSEQPELVDTYTIKRQWGNQVSKGLIWQALLDGKTLEFCREEFRQEYQDLDDVRNSSSQEAENVRAAVAGTVSSKLITPERKFTHGQLQVATVTETGVELEGNPDHPSSEGIELPGVTFERVTSDTRGQFISSGQIDAGSNPLPDQLESAVPDGYENLDTWRGTGGWKLHLNFQNTHIERVNVRRAILAAIDTPQIQANSNLGGAPVETQVGLGAGAYTDEVSQAFLDKLYDYPHTKDIAAAEGFLEREGYQKINGTYSSPDQAKVKLSLLVTSKFSKRTTAADAIKANLEELGFKIDLEKVAYNNFVSNYESYNYDIALDFKFSGVADSFSPYQSIGFALIETGVPRWKDPEPDSGKTPEEIGGPAPEKSPRNKAIESALPKEVGCLSDCDEMTTYHMRDDWKLWRQTPETLSEDSAYALTKTERLEKMMWWWNYYLPDIHISTAQNGVWGNTSAYNWPDETGPMGPYQERGLYGMIKNDMITPK